MVLDSLLAGVMLFSSFAARTPNTQPNPDDYEVSIGVSHPSYYFNRQWERELGEFYVDDLIWAKIDEGVYFKPEYMNKESHGVKYLKLDWRRSWKDISFGFTSRNDNNDVLSKTPGNHDNDFVDDVDSLSLLNGTLTSSSSGEKKKTDNYGTYTN